MNPLNALVIDDSKSARFVMQRLLERNDCSVDTAESADEGLNKLDAKKFDIVFLDHLMPGTSGFEVLGSIRANPALATTSIVMCSSNQDPGFVERARSGGAMEVLGKPPSPLHLHELLDIVRRQRDQPLSDNSQPFVVVENQNPGVFSPETPASSVEPQSFDAQPPDGTAPSPFAANDSAEWIAPSDATEAPVDTLDLPGVDPEVAAPFAVSESAESNVELAIAEDSEPVPGFFEAEIDKAATVELDEPAQSFEAPESIEPAPEVLAVEAFNFELETVSNQGSELRTESPAFEMPEARFDSAAMADAESELTLVVEGLEHETAATEPQPVELASPIEPMVAETSESAVDFEIEATDGIELTIVDEPAAEPASVDSASSAEVLLDAQHTIADSEVAPAAIAAAEQEPLLDAPHSKVSGAASATEETAPARDPAAESIRRLEGELAALRRALAVSEGQDAVTLPELRTELERIAASVNDRLEQIRGEFAAVMMDKHEDAALKLTMTQVVVEDEDPFADPELEGAPMPLAPTSRTSPIAEAGAVGEPVDWADAMDYQDARSERIRHEVRMFRIGFGGLAALDTMIGTLVVMNIGIAPISMIIGGGLMVGVMTAGLFLMNRAAEQRQVRGSSR